MDKFIYDKWRGRVEFNASIMDYSSAYQLLNDPHKLYQSDKLLDQLWQKLFEFNKQEKTHEYKFHVWKKSMSLRYGIEFFFVLAMTIFFQIEIGTFNKYLHLAKHEIIVMEEHRREVGFKDDFYHHEMEILHYELKHAGKDLQKVLAVSYIQLLLPVNLWHRYFFFRKTNRKTT